MKIDRFTSQIPSLQISPDITKASKAADVQGASKDFGNLLFDKLQETDQLQKTAETATADLATGKTRNLHEAILAMEMADTSLRMMVTVRNKAIEAYQEIMRMPV